MDLTNASISDLRDLAAKLGAAARIAGDIGATFEDQVRIDLCGPLLLRLPVFPAPVAAEAAVQPADPVPPLADAAAGEDCAGGVGAPPAAEPVRPALVPQGTVWTEEDDALIVAEALAHPDRSVNDLGAALAGGPGNGRLGRTAGAIAFRAKNALAKRIAEAKLAATRPAEKPPASPAVSPSLAASAPVAPVVNPEKSAAAPSPATVAPPPPATDSPPPPPAVVVRSDVALPMMQRIAREHLAALGNQGIWTADLDLALVEALAAGAKLAEVAQQLRLDAIAARNRYFAIIGGLRDDGRSTLAPEMQPHLLAELRQRAASAGAVA